MTTPKFSIATESGRYYDIDGRKYRSITNIIGATESKPFLITWAAKLAAESGDKLASEKVRDAASERGNILHDFAEQYALGNDPSAPLGLESECIGLVRCIQDHGLVFEAAEATVYSPEHGYAGTGDAIAVDKDGVRWCIDWKSSKSAYPSYALQLVALQRAELMLLPDGTSIFNPPTDRACVVHITTKGTKLIPTRTSDLEWEAFLHAAALAEWHTNGKKGVFSK